MILDIYLANFGHFWQKPVSFTVRNDTISQTRKNTKKCDFPCFSCFSEKRSKSGVFLISRPSSFCTVHGIWKGVSGDDHFFPLFATHWGLHFGPLKTLKLVGFYGFSGVRRPVPGPLFWPDNSEKWENGRKWAFSHFFTKMVEKRSKNDHFLYPFLDDFDSL